MKKPSTQQFVLRLIAGLAMIGLAVYFAFTLDGFTGPESTMLQRTIFILSVMGVGLAGLGCIFFGILGTLGGLVFVLVLTLPRVLPDPWNRYFSLVYILFLFAIKPLTKWLTQRKATKAAPKQSAPAEIPEDNDSILPGNSVVAMNTFSGRAYQLFRHSGQLWGYRVGGELRGIDAEKLRVTPGDLPDFTYGLDEIQKVRSKPHGVYGVCITCKAGGHTYYFAPTAFTTGEELEDFFRDLAPDQIPQKQKKQPLTQSQTQRRAMLSKIRMGMLVVIAVIALPWMFLYVPYKLFAALSLLPCPAILALCCLYPDDITLDDKPKNTGDRVEFLTPLIFSGFAPALRLLFDFNILNWPRLLIFAAVILAVIFAVLFFYNKPLRSKLGTLILVVVMCAFFAVGSIGQLNYLLDFSEPQTQSAQIIDMHISTSTKGPDRYVLDVVTVDGTEMELQVSESEYQSLTLGDQVMIFILSGGLGIPYAFVG